MTTYLVIGLAGLALLAVSLIAGDLLDGIFDGLLDALSADWFSTAVIGGFVSAFGFGGALADAVGASWVISVPVGVVAGVAFGWFASSLTRLLRGSGTGETVQTADTVGYAAMAVTGIPEDGFGVVRVRIGAATLQLNARAETRQAAEQARIKAEEEIAVSQRALALKQAEIKAETDAAAANAAVSGPMAQAERDQSILLEQEKVAVHQAALTERNLETEVGKPADAARCKVEQEAEGNRTAEIAAAEARKAASFANAQATAEETRLSGEAEKSRRAALAEAEAIAGERQGQAERSRRVAEAEATRAEGDATAAATLAVGQAEAEAMDRRAEAFAYYNDAAVLQMLIEVLPQAATEVAAPISAIKDLTIVSADGAGALPKQVTDNVVQTLSMLKTATRLDLEGVIKRAVDGAVAEPAAVSGSRD